MKRISIIIVNYNGRSLLEGCLAALKAQTFTDYEIILVDNGSQDNSQKTIKQLCQTYDLTHQTTVRLLTENSGFPGGNIRGLEIATGDYIATLNNDTEVDKDWLKELVLSMESDPKIGICASLLLVHGTKTIDSAADGVAKTLKGFKRGEGEGPEKYTEREYVFGACAGAALYRREMLDDIGFFDEDFFLIHEDTDLNFRAQLAGWKVLYVPTAVVRHKVRSSIGTMSATAVYYSLRNSEWVRMKNVPAAVLLWCLPQVVIDYIAEFFYFAVKHGFLRLYCKAKFDAWRNVRKMYCKRKEIMKRKRISNRYLLDSMTPAWDRAFFLSKLKKLLHH